MTSRKSKQQLSSVYSLCSVINRHIWEVAFKAHFSVYCAAALETLYNYILLDETLNSNVKNKHRFQRFGFPPTKPLQNSMLGNEKVISCVQNISFAGQQKTDL